MLPGNACRLHKHINAPVMDRDEDTDGDVDGTGVPLGVSDGEVESEAEGDSLSLADSDRVGDGDADSLSLPLGLSLELALVDLDVVRDRDVLLVGERVTGVLVLVREAVPLSVSDANTVTATGMTGARGASPPEGAAAASGSESRVALESLGRSGSDKIGTTSRMVAKPSAAARAGRAAASKAGSSSSSTRPMGRESLVSCAAAPKSEVVEGAFQQRVHVGQV